MKMKTYEPRKIRTSEADDDEIIEVRKRSEGNLVYAYHLVTKKSETTGAHPCVHRKSMYHPLEELGGYSRLLKEYTERHPKEFPELAEEYQEPFSKLKLSFIILALMMVAFPQLQVIFPQISPLKSLLLNKMAI